MNTYKIELAESYDDKEDRVVWHSFAEDFVPREFHLTFSSILNEFFSKNFDIMAFLEQNKIKINGPFAHVKITNLESGEYQIVEASMYMSYNFYFLDQRNNDAFKKEYKRK